MMLPFRRRPTQNKPVRGAATAESSEPKPASAVEGTQHLDYDLQPLKVEHLSHYIEPVVDDERFRVH